MVETGKRVIEIEALAIQKLKENLDSNFTKAVELLFSSKGRIIVTGMGKSGIIARKISATMTSTGSPSIFMHPADAVHGDLGIILSDDIIIAISYSGETIEILNLINFIKRMGTKLIAITGNTNSTLAKNSDVILNISVEKEACPIGLVPTTSTTAALVMGDALAVALMEKKGFSEEEFLFYHPRGQIGKNLLKVKHLMHVGDEVPVVKVTDPMEKVLKIMTEKKLGVTSVIDLNNKLVGIITDGDLRRLLIKYGNILDKTAQECMHENPLIIDEEEMATKALNLMEEKKITSLLIKNSDGGIKGIVHLHDLWKTEMF
ncbi:MAG: KpsF/GutQ family sugar-phosphate isomerase [Acidobacteriota bacterium]